MTEPTEVGQVVIPKHPVRGVVVKRDNRGGKPGSLVRWPGMQTPMWHPDGDLVVVPEGHRVVSITRSAGTRAG